MTRRRATLTRDTRETRVAVEVVLDGTGESDIQTGIGFLDHLFTTLTLHARMGVTLTCQGDLAVDDHHSAEDCALLLGSAIDHALGERRGIRRFGSSFASLDEALARAVVDISSRPYAAIELGIHRDRIGTLAGENVSHVLHSLAIAARITLHVDVLRGINDHHRAEAAFKATALALREAWSISTYEDTPSTKGAL